MSTDPTDPDDGTDQDQDNPPVDADPPPDAIDREDREWSPDLEFIRDVFGDAEPSEMTVGDVQLRGVYEIEETGSGYTEEYKAERERESGGQAEIDEPPAAELTLEAWGDSADWHSLNELRERRDPFPVSVGPFVFEEMGITNVEQEIVGEYGPEARTLTIELQEFRELVVQERSLDDLAGGSGEGSGDPGEAQGPQAGDTTYSGTPTTVGPGSTLTEPVGTGETFGGELYDVSADGANVHINATGSDWVIQNVGLRGTWTGRSMENGDTFINATVNGGSAAIRHIYMADGANGTNRDTGIWYDVNSTGDLEIERVNAQGWPDNAIYASPPHESGGNNPNVAIRDSYSANNGTSCYRMGRGTIENCVGVIDGGRWADRGNRVVWARAPGTVELVDCQIANRNGGTAVMLGNGGTSSVNATNGTTIEGDVGRDGGGSINYSGGAGQGQANTDAYAGSIPGSPDEAAEGVVAGGGGGGNGDSGDGDTGDGGSGGGSGALSADFDSVSSPGEVYDNVGNPTSIRNGALVHSMPAGQSANKNTDWDLSNHGYDNPQTVTNNFRVYPGANMRFSSQGDNVRFFNAGLNTQFGNAHSGGRGPPSGDDGWSVRLYMLDIGNRDGPFGLNVYSYDMDAGSYGNEYQIEQPLFRPGHWHGVETTVRVNDPGSANGQIRIEVDGTTVFDRDGFQWTTTSDQGHHRVGPATHWGGNEVPPNDTTISYDAHNVYIG